VLVCVLRCGDLRRRNYFVINYYDVVTGIWDNDKVPSLALSCIVLNTSLRIRERCIIGLG